MKPDLQSRINNNLERKNCYISLLLNLYLRCRRIQLYRISQNFNLLTESNYCQWSEELLFFFKEIGLDYVLIEEKPSAGSDGIQFTKPKPDRFFEKHNQIYRGHIIRHLSEKLFNIYVKYESVKEIWSELKKNYGGEDEGKKQDCLLASQNKDGNENIVTKESIAVTTEVSNVVDSVEWIIDSGSTYHVCSVKSLFNSLNESSCDSEFLGDSSIFQVGGIGEVDLKLSSGRVLTLIRVVYVPNMPRNIISGALLMKADFEQVFAGGKLVLTKNGEHIGEAFCSRNMFVLESMNEKLCRVSA